MLLLPAEQIPHQRGRWGAYLRGLRQPRAEAVAEFEQAVASRLSWKHAIATQSGKASLGLILKALQLPSGSAAFVPAYTYYGLPEIVRSAGLTPIFVDVDPVAGRTDFAQAAAKWRPDVRVALHTQLFGVINPGVGAAAQAFGAQTWLVEDCAHAPLYTMDATAAAQWLGQAAFFSFDRLKFINTIRGGMILTHHDELADRVRQRLAVAPTLSPAKLASLIALHEIEALVRWPVAYAVVGRLLAWRAATEGVRAFYRRANRDFVQSDERFSPLQAELGLRSLLDLSARVATRRELIHAYLDRLSARVTTDAGRAYLSQLTAAFGDPDRVPMYFVVCLDEPGPIQAEARAWGFEALASDRVSDFCAREDAAAFPGASHLFRHAVKLPLPDRAPRDQFLRFMDRLTDRMAGHLAPFAGG